MKDNGLDLVSMEKLNSLLRNNGHGKIALSNAVASGQAQDAAAEQPQWKQVLLEYLLNMKRKGFEVKELGKVFL